MKLMERKGILRRVGVVSVLVIALVAVACTAKSKPMLASWASNLLISVVGPAAVDAIGEWRGKIKRDEVNWSGLYFHQEDDAHAFLVDSEGAVSFFYETGCCFHIFTGVRDTAGLVSGTMIRRVKSDGCLTEYKVSMNQVPGTTSSLAATFQLPNPTCKATLPNPQRRLDRR